MTQIHINFKKDRFRSDSKADMKRLAKLTSEFILDPNGVVSSKNIDEGVSFRWVE